MGSDGNIAAPTLDPGGLGGEPKDGRHARSRRTRKHANEVGENGQLSRNLSHANAEKALRKKTTKSAMHQVNIHAKAFI